MFLFFLKCKEYSFKLLIDDALIFALCICWLLCYNFSFLWFI